ncbi:hypothetical protein [Actinoplanes couchii]|uniref:hypothetical protein n=1 Tax=Actinoplanes couchii TaxID=403638 RepID=UPI001945B887|nr:hypothetical protein [Actinoplanes couchii]MDR6321715.1 putative spore protein YtfJ [Actinoplanes couchii]
MKLNATEILERARAGTDSATVERVFGTPIERDGVTVVPVAIIGGGAGSGAGGLDPAPGPDGPYISDSSDGSQGLAGPDGGSGSGGGYGFSARRPAST